MENQNVAAMDTLWTAQDVAQYLKSSSSWVYKAAERGEIPCLRIRSMLRFEPEQVRTWAANPARNAKGR